MPIYGELEPNIIFCNSLMANLRVSDDNALSISHFSPNIPHKYNIHSAQNVIYYSVVTNMFIHRSYGYTIDTKILNINYIINNF